MENKNNNPTYYFFSISKKERLSPDTTPKALDELNELFGHYFIQIPSVILKWGLKKDGIEEKMYIAGTFKKEADLREPFKDFIKRFNNEGRILEIQTLQQYLAGGEK
jgi:hypothetical protein